MPGQEESGEETVMRGILSKPAEGQNWVTFQGVLSMPLGLPQYLVSAEIIQLALNTKTRGGRDCSQGKKHSLQLPSRGTSRQTLNPFSPFPGGSTSGPWQMARKQP